MKKIFKYLLMTVIASGTMFYSCETLEMEDLADPNSLSPDLASADLLLNSIQLNYLGAMQDMEYNGAALGRISHMSGRNYYNNFNSGTVSGAWGNLYSGMLPDIEAISAINTDGLYDFHLGISKVMQAHVMMGLVDSLGDIVWSQANNAAEYPSPAVDSGESVYAAAIGILGEAATHLGAAGGGDDLFYGGDVSKWVKLHNTLLMRANLTTGNYAAALAQTNVIETAADDMQFNYGDQELQPDTRHPWYQSDYTTSGANLYRSNWIMNQMIGGSDQWYNLWGVEAEGAEPITDTRRRYYFYRQNWDTPGGIALIELDANNLVYAWPEAFGTTNEDGVSMSCSIYTTPTHLQFTPDEDIWCSVGLGYWGRAHGNNEGIPPDGFSRTAVGVYPAGGSFDNQDDIPFYVNGSGIANLPYGTVGLGNGAGGAGIWPIYLSSYVKFMKAEAAMWTGDAATAATYMQQGMEESIAKVQSMGSFDPDADSSMFPTAADNAAFVNMIMTEFNNAPVTSGIGSDGYPTEKDKLDILGEQYFVAMYGGGNDAWNFMRRTGYPRTLQRPLSDAAESGAFPRTGTYPSSEISANPNIIQRGDNNTLVFWDQGVTNPSN
jgi:hypothetical protein